MRLKYFPIRLSPSHVIPRLDRGNRTSAVPRQIPRPNQETTGKGSTRPGNALNLIWAVCLVLAGCATDPIDAPGTWRVPPRGMTSNDENLRAMLVNPRDLGFGGGETTGVSVTSAAAARRVLTGQRYPLPSTTASRTAPRTQGQTSGAASGTGTGSPAREE